MDPGSFSQKTTLIIFKYIFKYINIQLNIYLKYILMFPT